MPARTGRTSSYSTSECQRSTATSWRAIRREAGAEAILIAVTGYGDEANRDRFEAAFDHYLVKPAPVEEMERLLSLVKKTLKLPARSAADTARASATFAPWSRPKALLPVRPLRAEGVVHAVMRSVAIIGGVAAVVFGSATFLFALPHAFLQPLNLHGRGYTLAVVEWLFNPGPVGLLRGSARRSS